MNNLGNANPEKKKKKGKQVGETSGRQTLSSGYWRLGKWTRGLREEVVYPD